MQFSKAKSLILKLIQKLGLFIFPPCCPNCQTLIAATHLFCPKCWQELHFITPPLCEIYGTPLPPGQTYPKSLQATINPPPFKRLRSAVLHQGLGQKLITQYKYNDCLYLTPLLAGLMQNAGQELLQECDIIIPVPLHYRRYVIRQYNQAQELARFLAKRNNKLYYPEALIRIRHTKQQATLNAMARQHNVRNAFKVRPGYQQYLENKKILLIDDVYTTGATIKSASKSLLTAKIKQIEVLTFSCAYAHHYEP